MSLRTFIRAVPFAVIGVIAMAFPAGAAQAPVHQWWNHGSGGLWNLDQTVTVNASGPTRFFAHQFGFDGGDGGYLGIQDTPNGRVAIFSVWDSPGDAAPGPGAHCETFGGEGVGWHCMLPYAWQEHVGYRLRVWKTDSRSDGSTKWVASVTSGGTESVIGYLWTRAGQNGLNGGSASWIEDYGMTTGNCATEVAASAVFSYPTGDNGAVTSTRASSDTHACGSHNSSITDNGDSVTISE